MQLSCRTRGKIAMFERLMRELAEVYRLTHGLPSRVGQDRAQTPIRWRHASNRDQGYGWFDWFERADGVSLRARLTSIRMTKYVTTALGIARNNEPSSKGQPTRTNPGQVMRS